ncbi:hypothetical protein SLEP1_g10173 [Rubroshorea leprosula]|uniref:Uncharacterized protein n=1 Tax=Rubroshorea leprosula TaxID=152421 RepID=A0AAV5I7A7_9ROSI|nr:hypothetical protein SLEP1_g10173 [Rubroshorea leprosula]
MAQGFLDFDDDDDSPLELEGFEYFQCLNAHCFFQDFEYKHEQLICKIHDLVHDFALFLTRGEFMALEVSKGNTSSTMNGERTLRHLIVIIEKGLHFPEFIPNAEKLRSVLSYDDGFGDYPAISEKALCNLFNQARRLRVADVTSYDGSTIPEKIRNLLHLRHLDLAYSRNLKRLPNALFRLHNLENLNLYSCFNLERLPDEIRNLVNLRFLCTTGCLKLASYPKGVVKLTRLTQLVGLILRVDRDDPEEFSVSDLANLNKLLVLCMKIVGSTIDVVEAKKVKLRNLQEVKILVDGDIAEAEHVILESLNMSSVPRHSFQTDYYMLKEALVSTILQQITTIIYEGALEEVRLLRGVKEDLRNLKNNLTSIRALLKDAEEKQISDEPVKLWLHRLREESLDMEDALDEWRTVLSYRQTDGAEENASFLQRKVCVFLRCFSFHPVRYRGIALNIKEINGRLDKIAEDKVRYQLTSMPINKLPRQEESKSFIDESSLLGRDDVKNEIISHLLYETSKEKEDSPIQTISVVGIGGIGKTALAQLVYNDENVKQHFTCRVWTCVSDIFDESKVAKSIIVGL